MKSIFVILLMLTTIWSHSRSIQRRFQYPWEIIIFYLVNIYILTLYFFGYFGYLELGLNSIYISGIIVGIFELVKSNLIIFRFMNLTRALIIISPMILFLLAVPKNFKFTFFDEMHLWAANTKFMLAEDALLGENSATSSILDGASQTYPPAQQLFHYLLLDRLAWSESNVLIAQIIFISLCLIAINRVFFPKRNLVALFVLMATYIVLYLYGLSLDNILGEGFLAAHLVMCIGLAMNIKLTRSALPIIVVCLSVLTLIKPISFLFLILPISILMARSNIRFKLNKINFKLNSGLIRSVRYQVLFTMLPAITFVSWQFYIRKLEVPHSVGLLSGISLPNLNEVQNIATQYTKIFFGPLYGSDNYAGVGLDVPPIVRHLRLSLFLIVLLLAIVHVLIIKFLYKGDEKIQYQIFLSFSGFIVVYILALLFIYVSTFGEVIALVRYLVPILFCWSLVVFYMLLSRIKIKFVFLILFLVSLATPSSFIKDLVQIEPNKDRLIVRNSMELLSSEINELVPTNSKIYVVFQNSDGYEKIVLTYLIAPIRTNVSCSSLGIPYDNQDRWTCNLDFEKVFTGYDYLVLGIGDEQFWRYASPYLGVNQLKTNKGVYKIMYIHDQLQLFLIKKL